MPGAYTIAAVLAPIAVLGLELLVLRTGLLRSGRFWTAMAIVLAFQVPVDGWLTKPEASVVNYSEHASSGVRFPWNIPIEDFGFGFAMVALTLFLWRWFQQRRWFQDRTVPRNIEVMSPPDQRSGDPGHPPAR